MTLDEATAYLEGFFKAVVEYDETSPQLPNAPTGEPYLAMTSGGVQREGYSYPVLCLDGDVAIEKWIDAVLLYAGPTPAQATLYWCERPSVVTVDVGDPPSSYSVVTCRMLISIRPPA